MKKQTKLALINAGIAGALVFAGAFSTGNVTTQGVIISLSSSALVFLTKMRDFFGGESKLKANKKGSTKLFEFI